jgi:hypothetical protein
MKSAPALSMRNQAKNRGFSLFCGKNPLFFAVLLPHVENGSNSREKSTRHAAVKRVQLLLPLDPPRLLP